MKVSVTAEYAQAEFSPDFVPPWLAFRIDTNDTGIGRATWSTGDEAQYQSGAFTITQDGEQTHA